MTTNTPNHDLDHEVYIDPKDHKEHINHGMIEYTEADLEMHNDAIRGGQKVVIIDDLLATGGTIAACSELCQAAGADVLGSLFLIELLGLDARSTISPLQAHALLEFPA